MYVSNRSLVDRIAVTVEFKGVSASVRLPDSLAPDGTVEHGREVIHGSPVHGENGENCMWLGLVNGDYIHDAVEIPMTGVSVLEVVDKVHEVIMSTPHFLAVVEASHFDYEHANIA